MMVGSGETVTGPWLTRRELLRTSCLTGVSAAAGLQPPFALAGPLPRPSDPGAPVPAVFEPGVFAEGVFE